MPAASSRSINDEVLRAEEEVSESDFISDRRTHIEVCVRLRPLIIVKESSSSFLEQKQQQQSQRLRKPQILRLSTPPSHRLSPPRRSSVVTINNCDSKQLEHAWDICSDTTIAQSPHTDIVPGRTHRYTLDRVYGPQVSTSELFQTSVQSLVHAAMDGYHTSVLAYGQTSTGKTHTMMGTTRQPGITPLAVRECFVYLNNMQMESSTSQGPREFLLRVSYLEVYKEHIRDLLVPSYKTTAAAGSAVVPIRLFDSPAEGGLVIKGLVEEVVTSPEQVFGLLAQGEARRQVGATHFNQHSSRSHVILRLWIESKRAGSSGGGVRLSSLSLVDLAGSESVRLTGSTERQQEGHYINKSLMTLGQVVSALSEGKDQSTTNGIGGGLNKKHVPYRDSKLTRLLQPSLSGSAQVVLICCISPLASHIEESHNTFKFAIRAKKIPQKAVIQESDEKTLLQSYRDEIEELKRQLREAQEDQERLIKNNGQYNDYSRSSSSSLLMDEVDEDEIGELIKSIQTMERLILKSRPLTSNSTSSTMTTRPEDLIDNMSSTVEDDDRDEENLLALVDDPSAGSTITSSKYVNNITATSPSSTPRIQAPAASPLSSSSSPDQEDLHKELSRIQGLLGSVLKKRAASGSTVGGGVIDRVIAATTITDEEVRNLRAQLEMQEVASSLRKADASFLQQQLEEKDDLLQEVSNILEAVENRQIRLEEENAALRRELALYKERNASAYEI